MKGRSFLGRLIGRVDKPESLAESRSAPGIATIKFDASALTQSVKTDLLTSIKTLPDFEPEFHDRIFQAALVSVSRGRGLHYLVKAILDLNVTGMTKKRAGDIALWLNNRATSLMNREKQLSLGISEATWLYAGAPCIQNPKKPSEEELKRDAAHKAANGRRFSIQQGMLIDGQQVWPGTEMGCRCIANAIIKGFK